MIFIFSILKFIAWYVVGCFVGGVLLVPFLFLIDYSFGQGWINQKYNPELLWGPIFSEAERKK